jgi:very-short-patch-repair endonuclease
VEVDGAVHRTGPEQFWDRRRQEALERNGYRVVRIASETVLERIGEVFELISGALEERPQ